MHPDDRACPSGNAVDGQILPGLPVNVVHTTEPRNSRACPTMPAVCGVRYDNHCEEENTVHLDNCFVSKEKQQNEMNMVQRLAREKTHMEATQQYFMNYKMVINLNSGIIL